MDHNKDKTALVTGAAGFIGYHISKRLLEEGWRVIGLDCLSDYYDVTLKQQRESMLMQNVAYRSVHEKIETPNVLTELFDEERPNVVIHLAAQAGVRYSIDNPRTYFDCNLAGTFELLETVRFYRPKHVLIASSSSVYGANLKIPFHEADTTDQQLSFYAATKKSTESIAHSYSHVYDLPITMLRLFTVYGPWGRPDMAIFKFTKAILNGDYIDVYNHGDLSRDFTYIDDVIKAIEVLIFKIPSKGHSNAPFRVLNIGKGSPTKLMDFIRAIETATGLDAKIKFLDMQTGDVHRTWADTSSLMKLTGFKPYFGLERGVPNFVEWYRDYYENRK